MPTAAHVVEKIIRDKPFLHEALRRGIVNNAALAEILLPDIQEELGKEVSFSAVNMALRRLTEKLSSVNVERVLFDPESDITTRSPLVEITVHKTGDLEPYIRKLHEIVDLRKDFLTTTQGLHEFMVITNEKHLKQVTALFPKDMIKKIIPQLASVTVHISDENVENVGMFYTVTRAMAWENINIVDIVSTYTELTFIIHDRHTGRAIEILRGLIERS